jgi:tripartite-type tricarboxylate transporter receptor subunit TctC
MKKYFYLLLLCVLSNVAWAQTQAQIIVGTAPGSAGDVVARSVQDVLIENNISTVLIYKPGVGGALSMDYFYNQKEKNTITLMANGSLVLVNYYGTKNTTVDPSKFYPIINFGYNNPLLLSRKDLRVNSIQQLNQLKLPVVRIGNIGGGGITTMLAQWVEPYIQSTVVHVPYKSINQGIVDLLGGHLDLLVDLGQNINHVHEQNLNLVSVLGDQNWTGIRTAKTLKQQNIPPFPLEMFFSAYAHPDNNPTDNQRIRKLLTDAMASGKFDQAIKNLNLTKPHIKNLDQWWIQQNKEYQDFYNKKQVAK